MKKRTESVTASMLMSRPKDACASALEDAAALIECIRARVEAQRDELDTAVIEWVDASEAQRLAFELLAVAAAPHLDTTTDDEIIRQRVLADARERFARIEGR